MAGSAAGALGDGPEQGENVLHGRGPLDVVDGVKDESAVRPEDVDPLAALPVDLVGRSERQRVLRVDPASPEHDSAAEFPLQADWVHLGGGALHRVEDVESG